MKSLLCLLLLLVAMCSLTQTNAAKVYDVYVAANGTDANYTNTCVDSSRPCKTLFHALYACPATIHILGEAGSLGADGNSGLLVNTSCSFVGEGDATIDMQGATTFFADFKLTESITVSGINFKNAVVSGRDLIAIDGSHAGSAVVTIADVWFENINVQSTNNSIVNTTNVYSTQYRRASFNNNQGLALRAVGGNSLSLEATYLTNQQEVSHQIYAVPNVYIVDSIFENSHTGLAHPALFNIFGGSLQITNSNFTNVKAYGHAPVILLDNCNRINFFSGSMVKLSNDKLYDPFMNIYNAMDLYISSSFLFAQNYGGINIASVLRGRVAAQFVENIGPNAIVTNGGNFTWVANFVNPVQVPNVAVLSVGTSYLFSPVAPYFLFNLTNGSIVTPTNGPLYAAFNAFNINTTIPLNISIETDLKGLEGHGLITNGRGISIDLGNVTVSDITCNGNSTIMFSNRTEVTSFDCWSAKQSIGSTCTFVDFCDHCTGGSSCYGPPPTQPPSGGGPGGEKPLTHRWWFVLLIILAIVLVLVVIVYLIKKSNEPKKDGYEKING